MKRASAEGLTEAVIRQHIDERSFRLGKDYAADDSIFRCRKEGDLLKARCYGNSENLYVLSARIQGSQILSANCSCPVGGGGHCKHMAAMLLTVIKSPEAFLESDPLDKRLAACDKPQLVELIKAMLDQSPDLEEWLELALPTVTSDKSSPAAVKPDAYRQKAADVLANAGYDWDSGQQAAAALEPIQKIGKTFLKQKNFASAAAVFSGILAAIADGYDTIRDDNGDVCETMGECVESLAKCLPKLPADSELLEPSLASLFDLIRLDSEMGGMGFADGAYEVLIKAATPAVRPTIVKWIRKAMTANGDSSDKQFWGGFLMDFEGEPENDDAYLQQCREFGRIGDVVDRLLKRGRLDEALKEIHASSDYELMGHADRLIAHKHVDLAHQLIQDRLSSKPTSPNRSQLRYWLEQFYKSRKKWAPLLEHCQTDFREYASLAGYQEIRKLSQKLNTWEALRPELLAAIPKNSEELIRIHLDEGDISRAIELLEAQRKRQDNYGLDRIDLELAKAAEKTHPETSLKLYQAEADRLIHGRGRQSYASASGYLKKAQQLAKTLGRSEEFATYLAKLREEHRILRAFQEELRKAGL